MKQTTLGGRARSKTTASSKSKRKKFVPRKRRRRVGRQTLNYLLLFIVAAAIMTVLCMTVLFQVGSIITDGLTRYAPQELRDVCGVKVGDNLLRINERVVSGKIKDKFPYVEGVTLGRQFPDILVLEVTEATVLGACQTKDGYVVIGDKGRILETGLEVLPAGERLIYGAYFAEKNVGHVIGEGFAKERQEEKEREIQSFTTLTDIVTAINATEFDDITLIDLSDTLNNAVVYDNRILIELGSVADLDYKLQFVEYVLTNQLSQGFEGVIDASYCTTSKSVVTSVKDIAMELDARRARISDGDGDAKDEGEDAGSNTSKEDSSKDASSKDASSKDASSKEDSSKEDSSKEDDLYALSDDEPSSAVSSSSEKTEKPSTSSKESSSSEVEIIGPYSAEELAVKPGTGTVSSSSEASLSKNESSNASNDDKSR